MIKKPDALRIDREFKEDTWIVLYFIELKGMVSVGNVALLAGVLYKSKT